jgi:hypothetical protein
MADTKRYGHFFIFEVGDKVVKILPSELDNKESKLDMSKPQTVESIEDMYIESTDFYYQILKIVGNGKHSALDFRPPDELFTDEIKKDLHKFFINLRSIHKAGKRKTASRNTTTSAPKFNKNTDIVVRKFSTKTD